jgi:hypothetical protein
MMNHMDVDVAAVEMMRCLMIIKLDEVENTEQYLPYIDLVNFYKSSLYCYGEEAEGIIIKLAAEVLEASICVNVCDINDRHQNIKNARVI